MVGILNFFRPKQPSHFPVIPSVLAEMAIEVLLVHSEFQA